MKTLDRYLGVTIINTTLMVLVMLVGLTLFINLIKEISAIGTGAYGLIGALEYVLLDLPQTTYSFFPMATLIGVLLGLSLLAHHSELIILRASGVSIARITWSVMKAAILLLIIATILGEWLAPIAEHTAENRKEILTSGGQALVTGRGLWIRDGQNIINIQTVIGTRRIDGVNRYVFDSNRNLIRASHADSGIYQHGQWVMKNIASSYITPTAIHSQQQAAENWQLSLDPKLLRISVADPDEMSLFQLDDYIHYLTENNLNSSVYALNFWQRVLQPLATLIMVWLAIPFVFGSLRSMTMGLRIVLGILVGFSFFILNEFFGPFSVVYQWPPLLAASLPLILFAIAAYVLQKRLN
jgi:lipopolysaccharide export system permease protein